MIESMDNENQKENKRTSDSSTPALDNFSRDLIKLAEQGKLDPVVGREKEILRIAQILSRRKKNNPIIIGEPGCGKTAIVEGLAMKIYEGDCPRNLADKRILSLDMTSIVAGTKYRGQFEERMKVVIEELQANPDIIIFIDEIHTIVGAGNSSGSLDASNIFKPALARGEIQCIGATTLDEYRKNFEKDGALERRFQKVIVDGATKEETLVILQNLKDRYENFHKVSFSDEVLQTCVNLAERYITDREFPDKAIDILDEVGARSQVDIKLPEIIEELKLKALDIKNQKVEVVKSQKYEEAAQLRDKERKITSKLEEEKKKFEDSLITKKKEVSLDLVYDVVSNMTKIPVSKLNADDTKALVDLDSNLNKKVIGQPEAVKRIAKPPGYVGYDEGGQLTEQVKNKPYSVILFDEIEKANKDIFSSLLQMLDDGHMTDGLGRKINFKNCIIIMTSNLGVKKLQDFGNGVGFSNSNNAFVNEELRKQTLQKELKKFFAPEFLNRIDDTIIFNSLGQNDVDKIVAIELDKLKVRLDNMKYNITFDESISKMISKVGFDEMYGARPLKRAIQDKVEDFISEEVLKGNLKEEVKYVLITEDGENVTIQSKNKKGV